MNTAAPVSMLEEAMPTSSECLVGQQIVLDLYGCDDTLIDDIDHVREAMLGAARAARATIVQEVFHRFAPWGVSGVVVIAESHLAIHTWPERGYAAVDVFTCGTELGLRAAVAHLQAAFRSSDPRLVRLRRGDSRVPLAFEQE
ncbi:adenosylmethionine decarboxylase [Neoroseomonas marina]|nr:adenosylmethionine decarboxylase [Neoroseomonas marina]